LTVIANLKFDEPNETTATGKAEVDHYVSAFERLAERKTGPTWVEPIRKKAIGCFADLGFPTTKDEEWRYTSVAPILALPFGPALPGIDDLTTIGAVERATSLSLPPHRLVFVNGRFAPALSSGGSLPEQMVACGLKEAFARNREGLERHLARHADYERHAFVALNTALMEDGAYLHVPRGQILQEPIFVLFISASGEKAAVAHPRNLIVAEPGSQVTVVEAHLGVGRAAYFTNGVTEIVAAQDAVIDHYKLVRESDAAFHVATQQAALERGSSFVSHLFVLGGALVRNDVNAVLRGEGIDCALNGLFVAGGEQHVDSHTRIDHVRPHCSSRELYKGILDGKARGVFNGKIYVDHGAPKTDAKQTNKNLLLSSRASIDTKPQLEIYNNDVKCTHGSTIGQLSQDALFYMRTRGIGAPEARRLLTHAFASEIVHGVRVESVRNQIDRMVGMKLVNHFEAKERKL
jgi:Fe-S cluster assembly protein SufD